jgi:hypothetical protein
MGKSGPNKGCIYKLDDVAWARVEIYARCMNPLNAIADAVGINYHKLEREIKAKFNMEPKEWLESKRNKGRADFRVRLYEMALDGKHPILDIFLSKQPDWLGMVDEKSVQRLPDNSAATNKFLSSLTGILTKLSDKSNKIQDLEAENKAIEDAIYTELQPDNNVPTNTSNNIIQLPTNHHIIEHSSIIEQDNNDVRNVVTSQPGA